MSHIQICKRCVMDTTAIDIQFDKNGYCNFCSEYLLKHSSVLKDDDKKAELMKQLKQAIHTQSKNKQYDCVIGVSGGIDSSWVLVNAVKAGLKPLAVHMDNGWNSELAQNNISNLVNALNVDLHTYVIDWEEYRTLMQGFFDADVIDVELLYDNALKAVNYRQARKYGLQYILSGSNRATEGIRTPSGWNWFKHDKKNIIALGRSVGLKRIKSFPLYGLDDYLIDKYWRKIKWIPFLDYLTYDREFAIDTLVANYKFKPYPYKHYESIFTRFYQGYLLPEKFDVDKRKMHLSSLIMSGQMSREFALEKLQESAYPGNRDFENDKEYFLKKMLWDEADLKAYLSRPAVEHTKYPSSIHMYQKVRLMEKAIDRIFNNSVKA